MQPYLLWGKIDHTPLDVIIKILLWRYIFSYFDSNFLWKHINFVFSEKLWEKNNPTWVGDEYFDLGFGKPRPWQKYSPLGWDILNQHDYSWWILLILHVSGKVCRHFDPLSDIYFDVSDFQFSHLCYMNHHPPTPRHRHMHPSHTQTVCHCCILSNSLNVYQRRLIMPEKYV